MQDRNAFQGKMETTLQEWGAKLDQMKAKADQASSDTQAEWDKRITVLTAKREAMRQQLADLKSASDDAWTSMKSGVESAWHEFSGAFEEAVSKFK